MKRIAFAAALILSVHSFAQSSSTAAGSNPKVRAITAFVRLDHATYEKQVAEALAVLRKAKSEFASAGLRCGVGSHHHAAAGRARCRHVGRPGARIPGALRSAFNQGKLRRNASGRR